MRHAGVGEVKQDGMMQMYICFLAFLTLFLVFYGLYGMAYVHTSRLPENMIAQRLDIMNMGEWMGVMKGIPCEVANCGIVVV